MTHTITKTIAAGLIAIAASGCGGAARAPATAAVAPAHSDSVPPHAAVDTKFMSGMILHHAQAVLIAGWAPSHDASQSIRVLCERIVVGQQDETALMQRWLRDRGEPVPGPDSAHGSMPGMDHSGMDHSMSMPGMLTAEQLAELDGARGPEFDRLFLTFMIQHHKGALTMVDQLFGSQGAAQDETVFRLASDVYADQSTEIGRMERMLAALPPRG
jgi:uncharacterized protein (DUF305 family)